MPIVDFIYLCIVLYIIFNGKTSYKTFYMKLLTLHCFIEIMNLRGYFLLIGSYELKLESVSMLVTLFFALYGIVLNRLKISFQVFKFVYIFWSVILFSDVIFILFPYGERIIDIKLIGAWDLYVAGVVDKVIAEMPSNIWMLYVKIFFWGINVAIVKSVYKKADMSIMVEDILRYSVPVLVFGVFEVFDKYGLDDIFNINSILNIFLGGGSRVFQELSLRGDHYSLQGLCMEPSHYAYMLFILSVFKFLNIQFMCKSFSKSDIFFLVLIWMLAILSGGFSAYWLLFIFLTMIIIANFSVMSKKIYSILFLLMIVIFAWYSFQDNSYVFMRINNVIYTIDYLLNNQIYMEASMYGDSALPRLVSMIDVFSDFLNRPILGIGFGIEYAHSGFFTLLVEIGVVGLYVLWILLTYENQKSYCYHKIIFFVLFFVCNIPVGLPNNMICQVLYIFLAELCLYKKDVVLDGGV